MFLKKSSNPVLTWRDTELTLWCAILLHQLCYLFCKAFARNAVVIFAGETFCLGTYASVDLVYVVGYLLEQACKFGKLAANFEFFVV